MIARRFTIRRTESKISVRGTPRFFLYWLLATAARNVAAAAQSKNVADLLVGGESGHAVDVLWLLALHRLSEWRQPWHRCCAWRKRADPASTCYGLAAKAHCSRHPRVMVPAAEARVMAPLCRCIVLGIHVYDLVPELRGPVPRIFVHPKGLGYDFFYFIRNLSRMLGLYLFDMLSLYVL